jgi:hypothetical protein
MYYVYIDMQLPLAKVCEMGLVLHHGFSGLFSDGLVGVQPTDRRRHIAGPRVGDPPQQVEKL